MVILNSESLQETASKENFKAKIYPVGEIVSQIKGFLEKQYAYVIVEGEITNYSKHSASGHVYFALSDGVALLQCICWKNVPIASLSDGMKVYCSGKITAYTGRSQFQLNVTSVSVSGKGNLYKIFEELKAKLAAEGLFDISRKKQIVEFPKVIGVITSKDGDALQDILARLRDRISCKIIIHSVQVQGIKAADMIAHAIYDFNGKQDSFDNAMNDDQPDVLIIARGGGSMEDLWAFNEEIVVRAIASSKIPIISAIGHEMDYTLSDFASDKRAPTPTASIEMLIPTRFEIMNKLNKIMQFICKMLEEHLNKKAQSLQALTDIHGKIIENLYINRAQQLDYIAAVSTRGIMNRFAIMREKLPALWDLKGMHARYEEQLNNKINSMEISISRLQYDHRQNMQIIEELLLSFSYENVLFRGFCMASNGVNVIQNAAQARSISVFDIKFCDDSVSVNIIE